MSKPNENILDKATRQGLNTPSAGMSVPDGYFTAFADMMEKSLPYREELENPKTPKETLSRSFWGAIKPYVYMAAMFAGVWCMLQMFTSLSSGHSLKPMDENPVLAKGLSSDEFMKDYIYDDLNSWDIVDEMMEDGILDSDSAVNAIMAEDSIAYNQLFGRPDAIDGADSDLESPSYVLPI